MAATSEQVTLQEVTILTDTHTHQGKPCKKGDKIKVDAETKAFLIEQNVIKG